MRAPPGAAAARPGVLRSIPPVSQSAACSTSRSSAAVIVGRERFFSAGVDLRAVPTYTPDQQLRMVALIDELIGRLYACERPLVGAVNGHALGGGLIYLQFLDIHTSVVQHDAYLIPVPANAKTIKDIVVRTKSLDNLIHVLNSYITCYVTFTGFHLAIAIDLLNPC